MLLRAGMIVVGLGTRETDALLKEKRRHIFLWTGLMRVIGILVLGLLYQTQNRHISKLQAVQEHPLTPNMLRLTQQCH